jgi:hypothetical protein
LKLNKELLNESIVHSPCCTQGVLFNFIEGKLDVSYLETIYELVLINKDQSGTGAPKSFIETLAIRCLEAKQRTFK